MGWIFCREKEKSGVWKINPDGYYPYCSVCGYEPPKFIAYFSGKDNRTPYCSNCGAKMRKEGEDK